ncbi:hypothetical protein NXY05_20890 [Bacteroides fragilis]|nr:hypothetical protein [Bacteroides fragilis]
MPCITCHLVELRFELWCEWWLQPVLELILYRVPTTLKNTTGVGPIDVVLLSNPGVPKMGEDPYN